MPAAHRRGRKTPNQRRPPGIIPPAGVRAKVEPPPTAYGPISTPQGVSRTAFLRGAVRNSGLMKGDPKPKVGAPGMSKGLRINKASKGTIMKGSQNTGGWAASGNFNPRLGRR